MCPRVRTAGSWTDPSAVTLRSEKVRDARIERIEIKDITAGRLEGEAQVPA